jgi:hypothetical protein
MRITIHRLPKAVTSLLSPSFRTLVSPALGLAPVRWPRIHMRAIAHSNVGTATEGLMPVRLG